MELKRRARRLTQVEAARLAGMTASTWTKIACGVILPTPSEWRAICSPACLNEPSLAGLMDDDDDVVVPDSIVLPPDDPTAAATG